MSVLRYAPAMSAVATSRFLCAAIVISVRVDSRLMVGEQAYSLDILYIYNIYIYIIYICIYIDVVSVRLHKSVLSLSHFFS